MKSLASFTNSVGFIVPDYTSRGNCYAFPIYYTYVYVYSKRRRKGARKGRRVIASNLDPFRGQSYMDE